jgi:WbqC-like protein family
VIVCSHQPSFFPWVGYWNKVAHCDEIIMSCAVKLDYGGYQNRVPFNGAWLTVPVVGESKHRLLRDVRFHPAGLEKVERTIRQQLGSKKWPGAGAVNAILDKTLADLGVSTFLVDLNLAAFFAVRDHFGLATKARIDQPGPDERLSKCGRLVERVRRLTPAATVYLAGSGFPAYFEPSVWPAGLELRVQILPEGLYSGTVLQLIARGASLHEVMGACSWGAHVEADTGRRAACG